MSLAPGGGKSHLLYYLCARATLPISLNGKQSCVIIIDTDGTFGVDRLATQLVLCIRKHHPEADTADINETIQTCLKHTHTFRPQSLASTTATLASLPEYLFDRTRHFSFDRAVTFIALDSASAFYWQDKAEMEDAAVLAPTTTGSKPAPTQSGYAALATALKAACKAFNCPAIFSSWYLGAATPQQQQHSSHTRSFRPPLPAPMANLPTLLLVVQRKAVRKLPPGISITEALREAPMRQKAVLEGGFECFVNEWDLHEAVVRKLRECGGGFGFRIVDEGVVVDDESE